eukprot:13240381-Ditylum_brightwellii.AAC.1
MLKFLFFPNDRDDPGSVEESSHVPDDDDNEQEKEEEEDDLFQSFQHRAVVSALSGISVVAVVHGLSLFVPTELREKWFELLYIILKHEKKASKQQLSRRFGLELKS